MKTFAVTVSALVFTLTSASGNAALFDRGNGLIYDDVLNVTWLQDASLSGGLNWDDSVAWADTLVFGGFDDWRLASMDINMDQVIIDCSTASELDCRDNELGYMFYQNLGGMVGDDLSGVPTPPFTGVGRFTWSGTDYLPQDFLAWQFTFDGGGQSIFNKDNLLGGWAVRDGDVAVIPLPAAAWLMIGGLGALLGFKRR